MKLWDKMGLYMRQEIYYYDARKEYDALPLARQLYSMIEEEFHKGKEGVIFLCIGTDRSTGDSLGPLIGYKLKKIRGKQMKIFGTLERPVHAINLGDYIYFLERAFPDAVIVAVDASVGNAEHIGYVTLGRGALRPGLGVSKDLKAVGDIHITGIVGTCGNFDPAVLQSIRLSLVMNLADCISESIALVENLWKNGALV